MRFQQIQKIEERSNTKSKTQYLGKFDLITWLYFYSLQPHELQVHLLRPLAKIKVLCMLLVHLPFVLDAGNVLESVPPLSYAGIVCCHCTGRWAVLDNKHVKIGVHSTEGCCTATTMALTSIKQKIQLIEDKCMWIGNKVVKIYHFLSRLLVCGSGAHYK